MNYEILETLSQITKSKNIELEYVIETLESSLLAAAKKKYGNVENFSVEVNTKTGEIRMWANKKVVEEVADPNAEISLKEAKTLDEESEIGDELEVEVNMVDFGRNAILIAKQKMINEIRNRERERIYEEYKDKIGEVVTGSVQQIERGNILINLGRTEGYLPRNEQIPKEKYRQGDRIRAYILQVEKDNRGPQIILSRSNKGLVEKFFELEVPEIFERIIEIKAVAREPGERAKIAVVSIDERIDPVGACVGVKGARVQSIVRELSGERIDIVPWSSNPEVFVTRALAPAKVIQINITSDKQKEMTVVVEDDKLSLAIGRSGQNARLAAKLTGWKITILSESEYRAQKKIEDKLRIKVAQLPGVGKKLEEKLTQMGIEAVQDLAKAEVDDLLEIEGIGEKKALFLIEAAKQYLTIASGEKEKEENSNNQRGKKSDSGVKD